jgi:Uncharacterized membrane protein, putative virulence factor
MARWALMGFAIGFVGFSLVKVLVPGFYARQETRKPVRYGVIALASGMVGSVVFAGGLWWFDVPWAFAGLALSTALNAWINAGLLLRRLRRDEVYQPRSGWWTYGLRILLANAVMAVLLWWMAGSLPSWTVLEALPRALRMAEVIAAAVVTYFAVLALSGLRPHHLRHHTGSEEAAE